MKYGTINRRKLFLRNSLNGRVSDFSAKTPAGIKNNDAKTCLHRASYSPHRFECRMNTQHIPSNFIASAQLQRFCFFSFSSIFERSSLSVLWFMGVFLYFFTKYRKFKTKNSRDIPYTGFRDCKKNRLDRIFQGTGIQYPENQKKEKKIEIFPEI